MPGRKARILVLAAAVSLATLCARAEEGEALQPYQMVRSLQLVQDRIADGDHAALPMQKKLLELIDKRFREAEASDFDDKRNYRSMLIYAMSGGNPVTLDVVKARLTLEPADLAMADGILSYLNGRTRNAREAFAGVDPMAQTADLGAFLALVKGTLEVNDDPADAISMFDKARLLGTGTLVEEAALRRSIALATKVGDAGRLLLWSSQYVRRFLRSPYASQFADAFVTGVVTLHATIDFDEVANVISGMEAEQRKVIYLRLARRAAIEGLADVAAFASRHVEGDGGEIAAEAEDPRAVLYASLSNVRSGNLDEAVKQLDRIERAKLSERDRQLLDAVRSIARQVTAPVETPPPAPSIEDPEAVARATAARPADEIAKAEEKAKAEGPLPDVVPTEDEPAPRDADAAEPAKPIEADAAEATGKPAGNAEEAAPQAAAGGVVNLTDGETPPEQPIDETTTAAALTAKGAREKLDAIDKLLQESADK